MTPGPGWLLLCRQDTSGWSEPICQLHRPSMVGDLQAAEGTRVREA